ncbi:MAG: hypothetical protein JXL97_00525 [Bacteroidales bacterium]|nr:hypothetical protein [Bacteroidales bacterium]
MKQILLLGLTISMFFTSCIVMAGAKKNKLTEEKVQNYINVYMELRSAAPDILENINKDPENADIGKEEYKKIESIIKDGGFENYADFVYTNAKIGSVFSIIQAQKGMNNFENLNESSNDMFEEGIKEIQKVIDDPETPEETRQELIAQIDEMKQSQILMNDTYEQNEDLAKFVLKGVEKISGLIVNEDEIAIIEKYEQEILATYVGFQLPELPDGHMPELNLDMYDE